MTDLIERLRYQPTMSQFANKDDMIAALLSDRQEAAAALEAAREGAGRMKQERANLAEGDAEIEALRAEVAEWKRVASAQAELHRDAEASVERLAEALRDAREYVTAALQEQREAFAGHEDCSDIPGIEADLHKIDAALKQEAGRHG